MDGKIIQEVDLSNTGFMKAKIQTFPTASSSTSTITTDFVPKLILAQANSASEISGYAIKDRNHLSNDSRLLNRISWYNNRVTFVVNSADTIVIVVG